MLTGDTVWMCEQWFGGELYEQKMFPNEADARDFARRVKEAAPDMMLKIEAMPIQSIWN